jgi:RHS repeat-associated protein
MRFRMRRAETSKKDAVNGYDMITKTYLPMAWSLAALLFAVFPQGLQAQSDSNSIPPPSSVVAIGSDFLPGSAIVCDRNGTILTGYHTVLPPIDRKVQCHPVGDTSYEIPYALSTDVRVLRVHAGYNLCLASIGTGAVSSISLPLGVQTVPPVGTPCQVVGYVGTLGSADIDPSRTVVSATIATNNYSRAGLKYYVLDKLLPGWFDGAGVFNKSNELIGIVAFHPDLASNVTFVVPMLELNVSQFTSPTALRNNQALADDCFKKGSNWVEAAKVSGLQTEKKLEYINEACRYFASEAVMAPSNPKPYVRLAQVLGSSGYRRMAIGLFRHAIALKYDSARAHLQLGFLLVKDGDVGSAMDVWLEGASMLTRDQEFAAQCAERCAAQMAELKRYPEALYFVKWAETIADQGNVPSKNAGIFERMKKAFTEFIPRPQQTTLAAKTEGFSKADLRQFVVACGVDIEDRNRFDGNLTRNLEYTPDSQIKAIIGMDRNLYREYRCGLMYKMWAEVHPPILPLNASSSCAPTTVYEFIRDGEGGVRAVKFDGRIGQVFDDGGNIYLTKYTDCTSDLGGREQVIRYQCNAIGYPVIRSFSNGSVVTQFLRASSTPTSTLVVQGTSRSIRHELTNETRLDAMIRPAGIPPTRFAYDGQFQLTDITHGTDTWHFVRDSNSGWISERQASCFGAKDIFTMDPMGILQAERRTDQSRNISYILNPGSDTRLGYINGKIQTACPRGPQFGSHNITLGEKVMAPVDGVIYRVPKLTASAIRATLQAVMTEAAKSRSIRRQVILIPGGILDEPLVLGPSDKSLFSGASSVPIIIQAQPGAECILKQDLTFQNLPMLEIRGLRMIGGSAGARLRIVNCPGSVMSGCIIVSRDVVFDGSRDTHCIGNTFDFSTTGSISWEQSTGAAVRNSVFLGNGNSTISSKGGAPTLDYNCYFPQPPSAPGLHSLVADPKLVTGSYVISTNASPLLGAGCAVSADMWPADVNGRLYDISRPCIGAVTWATEQTILDPGGAVIRRKICGRSFDYLYDGYMRLVGYFDRQNPSNNATYSYDPEGRRIGMTVGKSRFRFVYDSENVRIEYVDWDGDGRVDRQRTYWVLDGVNDRLGFVEHTDAGPKFFYYLTDQMGSVLRVIDSAGQCVNQYDYDAFGNIDWRTSFETVESRYRFQGMDWDEHAKHYNLRGRVYIPEWGIYLAPNLKGSYTFANGNPINSREPGAEE